MVDGLLSTQDHVVPALLRVIRDEGGREGVWCWHRCEPHRLRQPTPCEYGITVRFPHRDGGNRAAVLLFQFERTNEGVPFVVGIDNELNAIGVNWVSPSKGNPFRNLGC